MSIDAASVASVIDAVGGPVLVVAHSYGGTVISAAAAGKEQVIGLVERNAFHEQFCHNVPADVAALMAATQRPMTEAALTERVAAAAWMDVPSYFVVPTGDRSKPWTFSGRVRCLRLV